MLCQTFGGGRALFIPWEGRWGGGGQEEKIVIGERKGCVNGRGIVMVCDRWGGGFSKKKKIVLEKGKGCLGAGRGGVEKRGEDK